MSITLSDEFKLTTAVYSNVLALFESLISARPITMTNTENSLTLVGKYRSFTFDIEYNDVHSSFPTTEGLNGTLPVCVSMLMTEYVDRFGEIIEQAIDYVSYLGSPCISPDDVHEYEIDWNKWHNTVSESMSAFGFDDAADTCRILGYIEYGDEPDGDIDWPNYEVKAGELYQSVERMINTLICLYELHWDGKPVVPGENGYKIFNKCEVFRETDGQYYATLKFKQTKSDYLTDPCIEVRMMNDPTTGPWFNINLVAVGQFF